MTHALQKHVRQIVIQARSIAEPHHIAVRVEAGGRHPKLILDGCGKIRVLGLPRTPRSVDETQKIAAHQARRLVREMTA